MAAFKEPKKFGVIPGNAADVTAIQDAGSVLNPSMTDLFPAIYQLALSAGGKAPERTTFNALFKMIMERLYFIERGGVWSYDATADYPAGAVVGYSGSLYLALKDNGSGTDAGAVQPDADGEVWQKLPTLADVAKAFLLISDAEADYLKKSDASGIYLSKSDAEADYLKKSDASSLKVRRRGRLPQEVRRFGHISLKVRRRGHISDKRGLKLADNHLGQEQLVLKLPRRR